MKLTIICVLAFLAGMYAQQLLQPPVYELQERWHRVAAGETMWNIACKYYDEQDKYKSFEEWQYHLRKYNDHTLRSKYLQIGDFVRVPLEVRVK